MAPKGTVFSGLSSSARVETYDPAKETLREAVDRKISEMRGWRFQAQGGQKTDPVFWNGININKWDFFKDIFVNHPDLKFEIHSETDLGAIDKRSWDFLDSLFKGHVGKESNSEALQEYVIFEYRLKKFMDSLKKTKLTSVERLGVKRNIDHFRSFLDILRVDLEIRKNHSKSIYGVNDLMLLAEIQNLRGDPRKLSAYLESHLQALANVPPSKQPIVVHFLGNFKDWKEVVWITGKYPELALSFGGPEVIKAHWLLMKAIQPSRFLSKKKILLSIYGESDFQEKFELMKSEEPAQAEIVESLIQALESNGQFDSALGFYFLTYLPRKDARKALFSGTSNGKKLLELFSRKFHVEKWMTDEDPDDTDSFVLETLKK